MGRAAQTRRHRPPVHRAQRRASLAGALALRRSTAALAKATERFGSAQAALRAKENAQVLPAPLDRAKRSTPRAGRSAGRDDARTARERG